MNKNIERIKDLAEQSWEELGTDGWMTVTDGLDLEMFAELIIKECAKVADDNFDSGFCPVGGFIQEHFGISSTKKSSEDNNDRG